jgi:hypothetical protein
MSTPSSAFADIGLSGLRSGAQVSQILERHCRPGKRSIGTVGEPRAAR